MGVGSDGGREGKMERARERERERGGGGGRERKRESERNDNEQFARTILFKRKYTNEKR